MKSYKATRKLFERMEVAEKIYEGGKISKTPILSYCVDLG